MKLGFVQNDEGQIPFGFLDPAHVVRGCHLIPAFNAGRTRDLLDHSFVQNENGDWTNFYVNEYVLYHLHSFPFFHVRHQIVPDLSTAICACASCSLE